MDFCDESCSIYAGFREDYESVRPILLRDVILHVKATAGRPNERKIVGLGYASSTKLSFSLSGYIKDAEIVLSLYQNSTEPPLIYNGDATYELNIITLRSVYGLLRLERIGDVKYCLDSLFNGYWRVRIKDQLMLNNHFESTPTSSATQYELNGTCGQDPNVASVHFLLNIADWTAIANVICNGEHIIRDCLCTFSAESLQIVGSGLVCSRVKPAVHTSVFNEITSAVFTECYRRYSLSPSQSVKVNNTSEPPGVFTDRRQAGVALSSLPSYSSMPQADAPAQWHPEGRWTGTYNCAVGSYVLDLEFREARSSSRGHLDSHAIRAQRGIGSGSSLNVRCPAERAAISVKFSTYSSGHHLFRLQSSSGGELPLIEWNAQVSRCFTSAILYIIFNVSAFLFRFSSSRTVHSPRFYHQVTHGGCERIRGCCPLWAMQRLPSLALSLIATGKLGGRSFLPASIAISWRSCGARGCPAGCSMILSPAQIRYHMKLRGVWNQCLAAAGAGYSMRCFFGAWRHTADLPTR
jgi:hypothetical protein